VFIAAGCSFNFVLLLFALAEELKTEREKEKQLQHELEREKEREKRQTDAVIALTLALKASRKQLVEAHQAIVELQKRDRERERDAAMVRTVREGGDETSGSSSSNQAEAVRAAAKGSSPPPQPTLLTAPLLNPEPTDQELLEEAMRFFMAKKKDSGKLGATVSSAGSDDTKPKKPRVPAQPKARSFLPPQYQQYYQSMSPVHFGATAGSGGPVPLMPFSPYAPAGGSSPFFSPVGSPSFRLSPSPSPPVNKQARYKSPSSPTASGGLSSRFGVGAATGGGGSSARISYAQVPSRRISTQSSQSPTPSHLKLEEAVTKAKEEWLKEKQRMMLQMRKMQGKDNLRMSRSMGRDSLAKNPAASKGPAYLLQEQAPPQAAAAAGTKRRQPDRDEGAAVGGGGKRSSWSPVAALQAVRTPP
jgi:hypothetical protein